MSLHDMSVFAGERRVNLNLFVACIMLHCCIILFRNTIEKVRVCRQLGFRSVANTKFIG